MRSFFTNKKFVFDKGFSFRQFNPWIFFIFLISGPSITRLQSAETNSLPVTIPIHSSHVRIMVPAKINGSQPLSFLLDTGYGITTVHPDLIEPLKLKRVGRITISGIAGDEEAGTYASAIFDFGGVNYSPRRIASLPSEAQNSRRHRDGILGAGFFRRFVVEIDSAKEKLRLFEPESFHYVGKGEVIPLQFEADTPIIETAIRSTDGSLVRGRFEIDTGCDDFLCLGNEFAKTNHLFSFAQNSSDGIKLGVGGGARIQRGTVPQLMLGQFKVEKPSVNFFMEGSPAGKGLAGHIGMATLRQYIVIFDYSRRQMILEKNP
jgi:predicted aspartyl protease